MYLVNKHGSKVHLNDEMLPESMKEWMCEDARLFQDNVTLQECWLVQVLEKQFHQGATYEFVEEKLYDHQPSKEELLWLVGKYGFGAIATVEECYTIKEE